MTSTSTEQTTVDMIAGLLEDCLRETSVAESLATDWRDQLTTQHRAKSSAVVVTTIVITYSNERGWFTLISEGGIFKAIFWTPELRIPQNSARGVIDAIRKCLAAAIPEQRIQVRGIKPFDWLATKGWRPADIARIRR
ncbi:MAG: hypothetical protein Q8R35_03790 [bacterium]|nr:hypothetical protein [bacterium]